MKNHRASELLPIFLVCFFIPMFLSAKIPPVSTTMPMQMPTMKVAGPDSGAVRLTTLDIDVKIVGGIATTTMQLVFTNQSSRILEGELTFPMPEGVAINRYAIDINGTMRMAVPVEKAKASEVFEIIEKRRVDPGLLEKTEGNNFRTRIYPLPAHGSRKVLVAFDMELAFADQNALQYYLPLTYTKPIQHFHLKVSVVKSTGLPVLEESPIAIGLVSGKDGYLVDIKQDNYIPNKPLKLRIPKTEGHAETMMQEKGGHYYFYSNLFIQPMSRPKQMPKSITVMWDASLSGMDRNPEKELRLLHSYIHTLKDVKISLVVFSNHVLLDAAYDITAGDDGKLMAAIRSIPFDGGTQLGSLDINKYANEECLLFTDGLGSYGRATLKASKRPVYTITSSPKADFSILDYYAQRSYGGFINLTSKDVVAGLEMLTKQPLLFMGMKGKATITDTYPSLSVAAGNQVTVAGIATSRRDTLVLLFGYGNEITFEKKVILDFANQNTIAIDVSRLWAQKQLAELDLRYDANKQTIQQLGKRYGIVTRNTSLLVLEDVADYFAYEIEPPASLRQEYDRLLKARQTETNVDKRKAMSAVLATAKELDSWWKKDFAAKKSINPKIKRTFHESINITSAMANQRPRHPSSQPSSTVDSLVVLPSSTPFLRIATSARSGGMGDSVGSSKLLPRSMAMSNASNFTRAPQYDAFDKDVAYQPSDTNRYDRNRASGRVDILLADLGSLSFNQRSPTIGWGSIDNRLHSSPASPSITTGRFPLDSLPFFQKVGYSENPMNNTMYGFDSSTDQMDPRRGNVFDHSDTSLIPAPTVLPSIRRNHTDDPATRTAIPLPEATYLPILEKTPAAERYGKYLQLRQDYLYTPTFYFKTAEVFFANGDTITGLQVLSNLADLDLQNHEVYKMLGYKLKQLGRYEDEISVFGKIIEWRPYEPQSYRDHALALADAGYYQEAMDSLQAMLKRTYREETLALYHGIEETVLTDIAGLLANHPSSIKTSKLDAMLVAQHPMDIRVVLNWNMADTDIDLWVIDPNEEKCFYSHKATEIGGRLSSDFTQGYGPEQFLLKTAIKGTYQIKTNYYGSRQVKIAGATTVMVEIYTNFGKPNQQRKIVALQMSKTNNGEVLIGEFKID